MNEAKERDNSGSRWNPLMITLHWLCGFLVLALLLLGWLMVHAGYGAAERFDMYQLHKSLGFAALALFVARGGVRLVTIAPAPPPMQPWERRSARIAHVGLYLLAFVSILSGWLVVSSAIVAVPTRFFDLLEIPNIPGFSAAHWEAMQWLHLGVAWVLAALVLIYVGAALKHHLVDRDDVLIRMLPGQRTLR